MEHLSADGKRCFILLDGVSIAPTPRKRDPRYSFSKSYAPGKVAGESEIRKSKARALPSDYEYDPGKHMLRSNTTQPIVHDVGDDAIPVVKFGAIYHFVGTDGMLRHGVVVGQSATYALLATRDGKFTAPKSKLSPGLHPEAKKG